MQNAMSPSRAETPTLAQPKSERAAGEAQERERDEHTEAQRPDDEIVRIALADAEYRARNRLAEIAERIAAAGADGVEHHVAAAVALAQVEPRAGNMRRMECAQHRVERQVDDRERRDRIAVPDRHGHDESRVLPFSMRACNGAGAAVDLACISICAFA